MNCGLNGFTPFISSNLIGGATSLKNIQAGYGKESVRLRSCWLLDIKEMRGLTPVIILTPFNQLITGCRAPLDQSDGAPGCGTNITPPKSASSAGCLLRIDSTPEKDFSEWAFVSPLSALFVRQQLKRLATCSSVAASADGSSGNSAATLAGTLLQYNIPPSGSGYGRKEAGQPVTKEFKNPSLTACFTIFGDAGIKLPMKVISGSENKSGALCCAGSSCR